jgi:hypothetical protein
MLEILLRRLSSSGLRRGMAGSRGWLIVGMIVGGARLLRRMSRNEEELLYRTAIRPGDVFEVVTKPRRTK